MSEISEGPVWPPQLLEQLEDALLGVDVEDFWQRADSIKALLTSDPLTPEERLRRQAAAEALVPPPLMRRLRELTESGEDFGYDMGELLVEWEALRLDEEKLAGHLLLTHAIPPEQVLTGDHDQRTERHARLHREGGTHPPIP